MLDLLARLFAAPPLDHVRVFRDFAEALRRAAERLGAG
jgi:hypothetical protein